MRKNEVRNEQRIHTGPKVEARTPENMWHPLNSLAIRANSCDQDIVFRMASSMTPYGIFSDDFGIDLKENGDPVSEASANS